MLLEKEHKYLFISKFLLFPYVDILFPLSFHHMVSGRRVKRKSLKKKLDIVISYRK